MRQGKTILSALCEIDVLLSVLALAGLVTVTFLGVFMRYLFNSPFPWLDEVQMILILWLTCFGASAAVRHGGHIAIDMLVNLLPGRPRKAVGAVVYLVMLFMLGFLAWNSWGMVGHLFQTSRATDILRLPRAYIYAAMPLSAVFMIAGYLAGAVRAIAGRAPAAGKGGSDL